MKDSSADDCIVLGDDFTGYPTKFFNIPQHYQEDLDCVLLPRGLVIDRTAKMARDIFHDIDKQYDKTKPLLVICVLKGGCIFFNDLLHHLQQLIVQSEACCQMSIEFICVKSYQNENPCEAKIIGGDSLADASGKNLLIVEDIVETGRTVKKILELVVAYNPNAVLVASMLVKRTSRSSGYRPKYIGFEVPDKFLVGYGLDYNEYFRDVQHICVISESGKKKYAVASSVSSSSAT